MCLLSSVSLPSVFSVSSGFSRPSVFSPSRLLPRRTGLVLLAVSIALLPGLGLLSSASAAAAELTVNQVKEKFDQDGLALKVGDTVNFTNSDPVKHNLTVVTPDEESRDLGMEAPGASVKYQPAKAGVYDVRCSIHPKMKMKIKVE